MVKRIYKFATGDKVPEGAKYLNTVTQVKTWEDADAGWVDCWLVWHYYEVECDE